MVSAHGILTDQGADFAACALTKNRFIVNGRQHSMEDFFLTGPGRVGRGEHDDSQAYASF
jgi:hypothetical protein